MNINYALIVSIFLSIGSLSAQNSTTRTKALQQHDQLLGQQNINLLEGVNFEDEYRSNANEHRYFKELQYQLGEVSYNNQSYQDVYLRYDLIEDVLLVNTKDNLSYFDLKLIPSKVSEFKIHNTSFVKLPVINDGNSFYEVAYLGNHYNFYVDLRKTPKSVLGNSSLVSYKFIEGFTFLLNYNNEFIEVSNHRDFIKLFPDLEKQIKDYNKANKSLRKSDEKAYLVNLARFIDKRLTTIN